MNQRVKELLVSHLTNLRLPKRYSGFTLLEETYNLFQLHNNNRVELFFDPQGGSLTISNDVLTWAAFTKGDLEKLGLRISYYEDILKDNMAVVVQLPLIEWIEKVL